MKTNYMLLASLLMVISVLASCDRGEKMPKTVFVEINTENTEVIIASGNGPNNLEYCYVNDLSEADQLNEFTDRLKKYLKQNNIKSDENESCDYKINVTSIKVTEQLLTKKYQDTCSCPIKSEEVVVSKLIYDVDITLTNIRSGSDIYNLHKTISLDERICDEGCGTPGIARINVQKLMKMLTKDIRKELSEVIYVDQGF